MEFERFFKYIYLIIIQWIAFSMMYSINLEMIGYGVGIIVSFIIAGFLWSDIYVSPKSTDPVLFAILPSILEGVIALIIFATFLTTTHSKYNEKGSKIILTKESRRNLDIFRTLYVWGFLAIAVLSLMFFLLYKNPGKSETFAPFFEFPTALFSIGTLWFGFKVLLAGGSIAITSYMIYIANELSKQNSNQLYIPKEGEKESYKREKGGIMNDIRGFFRNVNLDYLMNYNISRIDG